MFSIDYACNLGIHHAYIGLGSNLETPLQIVQDAIVCLAQNPCILIKQRSSLYKSAPITAEPTSNEHPISIQQSAGGYYINSVIEIQTCYSAPDLLTVLQRVEDIFGRDRPYRYAPRTLDLDLLSYESLILDSEALTLPHPEIIHRAFVLQPLLEINPELEVAKFGLLKNYLSTTEHQEIERLSGYMYNCVTCKISL